MGEGERAGVPACHTWNNSIGCLLLFSLYLSSCHIALILGFSPAFLRYREQGSSFYFCEIGLIIWRHLFALVFHCLGPWSLVLPDPHPSIHRLLSQKFWISHHLSLCRSRTERIENLRNLTGRKTVAGGLTCVKLLERSFLISHSSNLSLFPLFVLF